jgi:hypothetical protein
MELRARTRTLISLTMSKMRKPRVKLMTGDLMLPQNSLRSYSTASRSSSGTISR